MLFNELGSKTGFQCNLIDQFFIIEGDTQLFSQLSADGTATAAKFAADGNNLLFHLCALLIVYIFILLYRRATEMSNPIHQDFLKNAVIKRPGPVWVPTVLPTLYTGTSLCFHTELEASIKGSITCGSFPV